MPDVPIPAFTAFTAEELAARRTLTRDAVASARIEGLIVSDGARELLDQYDQGRLAEEEVIARIHQLHAARR